MQRDRDIVERRLAAALSHKQKQKADLEKEIAALELQMRRVRRVGVQTFSAERSTSVQRLTVETAIVERLSKSVPPETSTDQLWPIAQALGVNSRSTLRSHLRRMKEKGMLTSPSRGRWRLMPNAALHRDIKPALAIAIASLEKMSR
ncbi:hypothetical protein [Sphingomonas sp. OK281]|uniref:hypothetical protein n=1 Tax=Sphingomonas sp. OK281 TaxID=1881067 RepID=UPI001113544E|nr:hypothetical protein [Sphingomonas sp. OK281]